MLRVEVPGTGQYFHDGDSITRVTQAACSPRQRPKTEMKFDSLFGYSYSCNIDITKDATGLRLTKSDDPMKYHVFAGCIDQLACLRRRSDVYADLRSERSGKWRRQFLCVLGCH